MTKGHNQMMRENPFMVAVQRRIQINFRVLQNLQKMMKIEII